VTEVLDSNPRNSEFSS